LSAYETVLDDVVEKLEAAVMACPSFTPDSVHVDYYRTEDFGDSDPICLIQLQRDSVEAVGAKETQHTYVFELRVKHTGQGTKENLKEIISYVGEIFTQVEASRTLGSSYIENTEISNVEYSMSSPPNFVVYHAVLTVEIMALRNV